MISDDKLEGQILRESVIMVIRIIFMLLFSCASLFSEAQESFVVKGKVSKISLAENGAVVVDLYAEDGCKGTYFKLDSDVDNVSDYVFILNSALLNGLVVSLHHTNGANCKVEGGVIFNVVMVQENYTLNK